MIKILVLGSNGQVGRELQSALACSTLKWVEQPLVTFCNRDELDLTDTPSIIDYLKSVAPTIIVNAAAYTAVDMAESQEELAFLVNEAAVVQMALYCRSHACVLMHISTDYVFDGLSDRPYLESDNVAPNGVYGFSKLAGEEVIRDLLDKYIILRTSWVFGATGSNFVKTMLRLAKNKSDLGVVADQRGAPTSARAIAACIVEIIRQTLTDPCADQRWGTYHYSGSPYVTWAEFAREIFEQAAGLDLVVSSPEISDIKTADDPTPAVRPVNSTLDCSKLKLAFDIEPDDWKRSLALMLDELKEDALI